MPKQVAIDVSKLPKRKAVEGKATPPVRGRLPKAAAASPAPPVAERKITRSGFRHAAGDEEVDKTLGDVFTLSSDPKLLEEQCKFLGIPYDRARKLTPQDYRIALDLYIQSALRKGKNAEEAGADVFLILEEHMDNFPGLTKTNSKEIKQRIEFARVGKRDSIAPMEPSSEEQTAPDGEQVKVYFEGGDEIIDQPKRMRRDGVTVGDIKEVEKPPSDFENEDLVGDRPPKNLIDLYHRWPIEGNSQYHIRVERTKPKTYQGINTAGLVAEIRGRRVTEAEIQQLYGGSEYKLTLYGPDPRSRGKDDTGEIKVKALTEPFTITVPLYPPNLTALPGTEQFMNQMQPNVLQPFAPQRPTTPSDAAIHKTETQHEQYKMDKQEKKEAEESKMNQSLFGIFARQTESQIAYERAEARRKEEDARRKEEEYQKKVEHERVLREKQEAAVRDAKENSTQTMFQMIKEMGPDREGEIRRMTETHRIQIETLRGAFEDQIKAMRDRHDGDLRRSDDRTKDMESQYRLLLEQERSSNQRTLDQERSSWDKRERDLREQFDKTLTAMEKQQSQRIEDMKERHATEVKTLERSQSQMMGIIKESFDTKIAVSEQTHQMMLRHSEERLVDAKEEAARIREEAEELKDLPTMLEKARASAEALGYAKSDADAPKDWKDRAVAMLGAGLTQFASSADSWMPQVLEQRQQRQIQMAQLAASNQQQAQERARQQQQQQAAAAAEQQRRAAAANAAPFSAEESTPSGGGARRTSGAQWASEGQPAPRPVELPEKPLVGFEEAPKAQAEPAQQQKEEIPAIKPVLNTEGSTVPDEEVGEFPIPQKFVDAFTYEGAIQFMAAAEQQIKTRQDPEGFAVLFAGQFPEGAANLVKDFRPEEIVEAMRAIEGAEMSPILTREGQKWLKNLWKAIASESKSRKA